MKKKDIIQLVKDTINEIGADAYGDATLTSQGQSKSRFTKTGRPPGVMHEISAERIKKIFDAVNKSRKPEFFKNRFRQMYGIEFPENLMKINRKQAISMNRFMNDLKINEVGTVTTDDTAEAEKLAKRGIDVNLTDMKEENLELTNDIGKDDYVDDEGRYAKSQIYKMGKYAMKLHDMLDDMEQLPAWLQSKLTKASDYMSMVYHYLDYEFARRDGDLMQEMDRYKEEMLEEPNEISYDDAKKKGLKNPDKADISKDKDISDYELKRGMAIQKAIEKQK